MAEVSRISALQDHYVEGAFGGDGSKGAGVILRERQISALVQINGAPKESELVKLQNRFDLQQEPTPRHSCTGKNLRLIWNGPYVWLAESANLSTQDLTASLRKAMPDADTTLVDLSHARTVIHISGPAVLDLLSKGCPLDLELMQPNDCAASLLGHFNVLLNTLENGMDIYVYRSFGLALWQWLLREAEEFGYQISA